MRHLLNEMRRQAQNVMGDVAMSTSGTVSNYDPVKYAVRVQLLSSDNMTGWIPLQSAWIGNGWGLTCPPSIGDLVEVTFLGGDIDSGVANLRFFTDIEVPLNTPSGEFWLVHKSGAFFKLLNSGAATVTDGKGATMTLNGDGTITSTATMWTHTGNVMVAGNLVTVGSLTNNGKNVGSTHAHSGVQTGGGTTGVPI